MWFSHKGKKAHKHHYVDLQEAEQGNHVGHRRKKIGASLAKAQVSGRVIGERPIDGRPVDGRPVDGRPIGS